MFVTKAYSSLTVRAYALKDSVSQTWQSVDS